MEKKHSPHFGKIKERFFLDLFVMPLESGIMSGSVEKKHSPHFGKIKERFFPDLFVMPPESGIMGGLYVRWKNAESDKNNMFSCSRIDGFISCHIRYFDVLLKNKTNNEVIFR